MPLIEEITILVPVFNNRGTLEPLIAQVRSALENMATKIDFVFVEDAGTDGSRDFLVRLARVDPAVQVLENSVNIGQQASIRAGLSLCKGDAVVVMDADLQDPPQAIPDLLHALVVEGHDAVFAARMGTYQSGFRMLTGRLFRRVMGALTRLPRGAGGFLILRSHVAADMAAISGLRFYLPGLVGCGDYRLHAIPVTRATRQTGVTSYSGVMRWKTAVSNIVAVLQERARHVRR